MSLFKKKPSPEKVALKCPVEGCKFVPGDKQELEKHVAWKHPELKK